MNDGGRGLLEDGGRREADEAPMLVSRDIARRMAEYARLLPRRVAEDNEAVLVDINGPAYVVGAIDPGNYLALRNVARALRVGTKLITPTRLSRAQFRALIEVAYGAADSSVCAPEAEERGENWQAAAGASSTPHTSVSWQEIDPRAEAAARAAAGRLEEELDQRKGGDTRSNASFVIQEAVNRGASDIHFEPGPEFGRIRFRIDGTMYPYATDVPAARMEHLVNALADMAHVNAYELPHAPCDAAIDRRVVLPGGRILKTTLRFASSPALYGVDVTIRLNINKFFDFHDIGFEEPQLTEIFQALKHKNGIILVTGETGSGKSNTLEAIIRHLEEGDSRKVIQVGDPIEFPNSRRTQIPIKPGCDWDRALKISLRKDPNIFSPGEFRDEGEARMVFRAGRTGHLVPTTVHTNDVATTFDRLTDLGIEPYNQGPAIRLIISQQLVRKLCPACREPDPLAPLVAQRLLAVLFPEHEAWPGVRPEADTRPWLYRAVGCAHCYDIGYRGRTVVAEVLRMTPELARMVGRGVKGEDVVVAAVREQGMITLAEAAARKLVAGVTSFAEVEHLLTEAARRRPPVVPAPSSEAPARETRFYAPAGSPGDARVEDAPDAIEAEFADVLADEDEWPLGM